MSFASWTSYPKIYALGHRAVADLFKDLVLVEEKVDGSQFSFGRFLHPQDGPVLKCRSRGGEINTYAPEKLFAPAVDYVKSIQNKLVLGWTYRGEVLARPKHNVLAYDRTPKHNIILFDIATGLETYETDPLAKLARAEDLDLECVPILDVGFITSPDAVLKYMERTSVLGGQKIEGVVVKNYGRFGLDGKPLMGKFVSEAFKEVHNHEWREANPNSRDVIQKIILTYRTPARWAKAVQHLKEAGVLQGDPSDIGKLIPEITRDLEEECGPEIRERLWKWAWEKIRRGVTGGVAEWYKGDLLTKQFQEN